MSTQDELRSLPPEYATVDGRLAASLAGSTAHLSSISSLPPPTYVTLPNEDDSSDAGTVDIPTPPRRLTLQRWRTQTGAADRPGASVASPTTQSGYYVYYRLFAPHGALVPQTSFDQSDPLVGRVKTSSFTPPYYPISLIRRLADAESIHQTSSLKLTLYKACTSDAPMSPQKLVPNIGINTGSTPEEALALVVENLPPEFVRARGPASTAQHGHYVYYRLFASDGALVPQTSFDPSDPLVGRVMTTFVCPPYYPASLFRCLADAEHIPQIRKWRLYKVHTSDTPMSERQLVGKLGVDVGSTPEEALILVADAAFTEGRAYAGATHSGARQCVYYSLHNAAGSIPSRHAFDPSEPHIGFLDRDLMPPPDCGRTLKACIARAEGKPMSLYWDLHVYDPSRGTYQVLDDSQRVMWYLTDASSKNPLRLVPPTKQSGVLNQPLRIKESQNEIHVFTHDAWCFLLWCFSCGVLATKIRWLPVSSGEIVLTDGRVKLKPWERHSEALVRTQKNAYKCRKWNDSLQNWDIGYVLNLDSAELLTYSD